MDRAILVDNENQCSYYYPYEVEFDSHELELAIRFANAMLLLYKVKQSGFTYMRFNSSKKAYDLVIERINSSGPRNKLEDMKDVFMDTNANLFKLPIYSITTGSSDSVIKSATISICALPSNGDNSVQDRYRIFIDQDDYHMGSHTFHEKTKIGKRLEKLYMNMIKKYNTQNVVQVERKGLGEVLFGEVS